MNTRDRNDRATGDDSLIMHKLAERMVMQGGIDPRLIGTVFVTQGRGGIKSSEPKPKPSAAQSSRLPPQILEDRN